MIVDDATDMNCPTFLRGKSAATVTHGFRTFLAAVNAYGTSVCLRTDNGLELTNKEFLKLMADNNIRREYKSADGPKGSGQVERELALAERGMAVFLEFQLILDGVELPAKALDDGRMWPEAWTWMCDPLNLMARVDEKPGTMCSVEESHERPYRGPVMPYMMPGRHKVKRTVTSELTGEVRVLPELRRRPRLGLKQDHAVAIRRRELLNRCDAGLLARTVHRGSGPRAAERPRCRGNVAG